MENMCSLCAYIIVYKFNSTQKQNEIKWERTIQNSIAWIEQQ